MKTNEETVLVFETYSGSRYEINKGRVRRLNPSHRLREDDKWLDVCNTPDIEVGKPVTLILEPLAKDMEVTVRTTSEVTGINLKED